MPLPLLRGPPAAAMHSGGLDLRRGEYADYADARELGFRGVGRARSPGPIYAAPELPHAADTRQALPLPPPPPMLHAFASEAPLAERHANGYADGYGEAPHRVVAGGNGPWGVAPGSESFPMRHAREDCPPLDVREDSRGRSFGGSWWGDARGEPHRGPARGGDPRSAARGPDMQLPRPPGPGPWQEAEGHAGHKDRVSRWERERSPPKRRRSPPEREGPRGPLERDGYGARYAPRLDERGARGADKRLRLAPADRRALLHGQC